MKYTMIKWSVAFFVLLFSLSPALAQCPAPTAADVGKVCVAGAGGAYWGIASQIDCANNQSCVTLRDSAGNPQNGMYLDPDQNLLLGPGHDDSDTTIINYGGIDYFLNKTEYNFNGLAWPSDLLTIQNVGSGCAIAPGGDNNMRLTAQPGGNGCLIFTTNRSTQTAYPFNVKFLFNVDAADVDMQFGVADIIQSGGSYSLGANQIRFRLGSGPGPAYLSCTLVNGGTPSSVSTTWLPVDGAGQPMRHTYNLFMPPQTSGEPLKLKPSDFNNVYVDAQPNPCTFPLNSSGLPSQGAILKPFLQFRNYGSAPKTLALGKIFFRSGF